MEPSILADARFSRTQLLIGADAMACLTAAHVRVFGLGGVGSYAAEGLARAGVGRLTLIDFDTIGLTNINRQVMAFSSTVGRPKVDVLAELIRLINPQCDVHARQVFFDRDHIEQLLGTENNDVVVDAIDSFNPKITLLREAYGRGFPVFSAMGAAAKIDPTALKTADISATTVCPFARRIRKRLKFFGITHGIPVVYSTEPPIAAFSPTAVAEQEREVTLKRGRERMIHGSISYLPALFGMTIAGLVVQHVIGRQTAQNLR